MKTGNRVSIPEGRVEVVPVLSYLYCNMMRADEPGMQSYSLPKPERFCVPLTARTGWLRSLSLSLSR